jgi:excisionase family DNA binding protein
MAELITLEQAASEFQISQPTLYRLMKDGRLRRYRGGVGDPRTYVDRAAIAKLKQPTIKRKERS